MQDQTTWVKSIRRDLHRIPEIGFDLPLTSAYVRDCLLSMGYTPISIAQTGWIVIKEGASSDAIAFRADMDALSVSEKTGVSFESSMPGQMHACGHDGHMTMLLGFAQRISTMKLKQTIVMIFQPAEEGPGGAKQIVEAGIIGKYKITSIFAIHLYPGLQEGKFGFLDGPMMAQNGEFDLQIQGKSSHGAQPHLGQDAILASAALIQAYHSIVSRDIDPLAPAVVTIGTLAGGEARNIIPQTIKLSGTFRSFETEIYERIKSRMKQIDAGLSIAYNVSIINDIRDYYPPVINDSSLFHLAQSALGNDAILSIKPMMFAEDFAFYQQQCKGLLVMLGTNNPEMEYVHPLHSCYFNFKEEVLLKGIDYYVKIATLLGATKVEKSSHNGD